ncbi:hypothetical protein [Loktanella sp. Alg231-35]|uniref:hypothetical protein n=1 Tax=Loktanella sp. Alg231-35 TaxID=1922220 RepID=UPI000D561EAE|nr:hypothetical protein [Loktanella sp. Alg231-35]
MEKDSALCTRIAHHLVDAINATPVDVAPCQHAMLNDVFPEDIYQDMLGNVPDKQAFRPMSLELFHDSEGISTRDLIELPDIGVARIAEEQQALWWAVGTAIMSTDVKSAVFGCLAEDLAPVFGCNTAEVNDQPIFVSTALRVETESYYMPPHFDDLPRVATMLLYLPPDDSLDGLGTSLYEYLPKWQRPFRKAHRELRRAPFLPNTGMYFSGNKRKSRPGWHGFERSNKAVVGDAPRVSLLTTWYTGTPETHADCPDIVPVGPLP